MASTFVLCDDKRWYKNPVLGNAEFFLCFDDDEPPEIVVTTDAYHKGMTIDAIIKLLGLDAFVHSKRPWFGAMRCFEKEVIKLRSAVSAHIIINSPPPAKWIREHDGVYDKMPACECVMYPFNRRIEPRPTISFNKLDCVQHMIEGLRVTCADKKTHIDSDRNHGTMIITVKTMHRPVTNTPWAPEIEWRIVHTVHGNFFTVSDGSSDVVCGCMKQVVEYVVYGKRPFIASGKAVEIDNGRRRQAEYAKRKKSKSKEIVA